MKAQVSWIDGPRLLRLTNDLIIYGTHTVELKRSNAIELYKNQFCNKVIAKEEK